MTAQLRFALYTSSLGNYFFREIRDLIGAGLRELGHGVELLDESEGFASLADWHLVVAPHEFFELGKGEMLARQNGPKNLVLFNTEQPSTQWFQLAARHFSRVAALWDIDFESSLRISKGGEPCRYLPLGYAADFEMFREVAQLAVHGETARLSPVIRESSFLARPFTERPIDLLFLGHASARREQFFARHRSRLASFSSYFHRPSALRPLIPGQTTNMNTHTSAGLGQRSKILLNVHHGVDKYFEWHRIVLLGIAQRALVITEPCSLAPPFRANVDYVEAPLDELPGRIDFYLRSADGRVQAQQIIDQGFETLTRRCCLREMLRPLVGDLLRGSRLDCTSIAQIVSAVDPPAPAENSLSYCVVAPELTEEGNHAAAGTSQVALAEMLARSGHRVTLLHTNPRYYNRSAGFWAVYFAERNVHYVPLPPDLMVPVETSVAGARSYEVFLWLRDRAFDVVHFPETDGIGLHSLLARDQGLAFEQTRFCLNAHEPRAWRRHAAETFVTNPYDLELEFMERDCFRLADALVTSTEFMQKWLEGQKWRLPAERSVRPDFVPANQGAQFWDRLPVRTLVYVGTLQRSSELELFCQGIERIGPAAWAKVSVVFLTLRPEKGGRSSDDYVRRRVRKWTVSWNVMVCNEADEVDSFLQQPGCLVILSAPQENSSPWVRRCLARGVRFLSSRVGGVSELVAAEDQARVLFAPKPAVLAAALQECIKNGAVVPRPAANLNQRIDAWMGQHAKWARAVSPAPIAADARPLVSVCLVHFNRPELLEQSVASLRAQDYQNFEVVLVDDGSTKPEAIQFLAKLEPEFERRKWQLVRQENRYLGAARNAGARHARGEYLIFMDDDNVAKPHEISTFVRVAEKTGADILTCAVDIFTGVEPPNVFGKPKARWVFLGAAAATGAIRNCFGDANACIRRDAFWRVGGFTEDYGITHEDWEFFARAVLQGCRLETIPEALFWYRTTVGSMITSTPIHANLQRSLRPYLAALPESMGGLLHFIQGAVCSQSPWSVAVPDFHDLLGLHQLLLWSGRELSQLGHKREAEVLFMRVLNSAETIGHTPLQLRTLMSVAITLASIGGQGRVLAKTLLEKAAKLAGVSQDQVAAGEVQLLQEALAAGGNLDEVGAQIKLFELGLPRHSRADGATPGTRPLQSDPPDGGAIAEVRNGDWSQPRTEPEVSTAGAAGRVSIIVLAHNQLGHTRKCVESLFGRTRTAFELILVNNGSTDGTAEYFLQLCRERANVKVITNHANLGFAAGNNQGLAVARSEHVVFLNNDTVVTENWLEAMLAVLTRFPTAGIVGPLSNRVSGKQVVKDPGYSSLEELPVFAADWAAKHAGESRVANRVVGFCLLARREVIEAIGGLDEEFGSGNFEDDDFCIRAHLAGFETRIADDSFVHHVGNATFNGAGIDYTQAMQANWGIFKRKWGIPPETPPFPGYVMPKVAPPGLSLKAPLPELEATHHRSPDGRVWTDRGTPPVAATAKPKNSHPSQPKVSPQPTAAGGLAAAREMHRQKNFSGAWVATLAAVEARAFHPEAYLLLAEIAQAAGDGAAAQRCVHYVQKTAPKFRPNDPLLKTKFRGNARPEWLVLPATLQPNGRKDDSGAQRSEASGRANEVKETETPAPVLIAQGS